MGSSRDTLSVLEDLNAGLRARYEQGEPIRLDIQGRPRINILSFRPLAYETYGTFRNRAPYVAGSLALRAFFTQTHPDSSRAIIIAGVEAGNQGYGFYLNGLIPSTKHVVKGVAVLLGKEVKVT